MRIGQVKVVHAVQAAGRHVMPFRRSLRRLRRALRPYEDDPGCTHYCITNGLEQIAALRNAGFTAEGRTVLEFGSGWHPLIPWLFQIAGAREVILTDIDRLMDARTMEKARLMVRSRSEDVARGLGMTEEEVVRALDAPLRHTYLVPWDAAAHPAESVDIVFSRATFEHIPTGQLRHFLSQFHRILRRGGAMCHLIDNSDHWQHRDRSLSRVNFLRFDDRHPFWRLGQINPQGYQNRLRHDDYQRMMEQLGFRIEAAHGTPDAQCLRDLPGIPLNHRFLDKTPEDLAVLTSLIVASKGLPGPGAA